MCIFIEVKQGDKVVTVLDTDCGRPTCPSSDKYDPNAK